MRPIVLVLFLLASCSVQPSRLEEAETRTDEARASAAAAIAQADEAERQAKTAKGPEADALRKEAQRLRMEAARLLGIADSLEAAEARAREAEKLARIDAEQAAWRFWTRCISVGAIALAALSFGVGLWLGMGKMSAPASGILAGTGLAVQAWGEALPWMAWALPVALLLLVIVAVIALRRSRLAAVEHAALADAVERGADAVGRTPEAIKAGLSGLHKAAGLTDIIRKARGKA